jgi:hypothetical protein
VRAASIECEVMILSRLNKDSKPFRMFDLCGALKERQRDEMVSWFIEHVSFVVHVLWHAYVYSTMSYAIHGTDGESSRDDNRPSNFLS